MYSDQVAGIVRRAKKLKESARQTNLLREELAHYFHFRRKGFISEYTPGEQLNEDIWNNHPEKARRRLAEGYVAAAYPKDRMWVGIRPVNSQLWKIPAVRYWCTTSAKAMYTALYDPRASFTEVMNEAADDASSFGESVVYVDHDKVGRHLTMQVHHPKDFFFEVDANGRVMRTYCFWMMSLDDLVKMFGPAALPEDLLEEYRKPDCDVNKQVEVLHAIVPNTDYARFGLAPGRLPLQSLWIFCKNSHLLDQGGYYEFPYVLTRWYRRSGERRARAVAEDALPDARLLQAVSQALLEITEKQGNPPMQGPIDILRGEIELFPGGFTPFDASGFQFQGDPLRPVQLGANPAMTAEYLQHLENKIDDAFFASAFSPPPREAKMSNEDAMAHQAMVSSMLGPVFSRIENEMSPPVLDRVFGIMMRARAFLPVPEELIGQDLYYLYDNYIADMREINEAMHSLQGLGATMQFAEHPDAAEAFDYINWDAAFTDIWSKLRIPEDYMLPEDEVQQKREQRQQEKQMAQAAELLKTAGPGAKQAIEGAVQARDQGLLPAQ